MGRSSALNLNYKVFPDWPIINIRDRSHNYSMGTFLLHFLIHHLTAFVDLVYRYGSEKNTLHFIFFGGGGVNKCSSHVGYPTFSVAKKW